MKKGCNQVLLYQAGRTSFSARSMRHMAMQILGYRLFELNRGIIKRTSLRDW